MEETQCDSQIIQGKLEVKLSTSGRMQQQSWEESEKSEKVETQNTCWKSRTFPKHCVCQMFCCSGLLSHVFFQCFASFWKVEKSVFQVKMLKAFQFRSFGAFLEVLMLKKSTQLWCKALLEVAWFKVRTSVAQSALRSQHVSKKGLRASTTFRSIREFALETSATVLCGTTGRRKFRSQTSDNMER